MGNKDKVIAVSTLVVMVAFVGGVLWWNSPAQIVGRYIDSVMRGDPRTELFARGIGDNEVQPYVVLGHRILTTTGSTGYARRVRAAVQFQLNNGLISESVVTFTVSDGYSGTGRIQRVQGALQ